MTVAPARAAKQEGGMGTQTSSHISIKKRKWRIFADLEDQIGAEGDLLLAAEADGFRESLFGGAELAALVELPVIGEIGFNGDSRGSGRGRERSRN